MCCSRPISNVSTAVTSTDTELSAHLPHSKRNNSSNSTTSDSTSSVIAPPALHTAFDPAAVRPWEPERFGMLSKLQDAARNRGQVHRMVDSKHGLHVAVKKMPNDWVCVSHEDFVRQHPQEAEQPWQDIGCTAFLNGVGYPYGCLLHGVYRDTECTRVVSELATEGDLFSWSSGPSAAAALAEREVIMQPLARQLADSVRRLHDMSIVHRDVSLENVLLSAPSTREALQIRVIDFGMASTGRRFRKGARGKASYQAPEMHTDPEYDAFLSDAFAVGVTLYGAVVQDYPWMSTRPGQCKCFEYTRKHGFRAFLRKRKLRGQAGCVAEQLSEPLTQLLEGLLAFEPAERLTLGESVWSERPSAWEEAWLAG